MRPDALASALTDRLTFGLGDRAIGRQVVARLDARALSVLGSGQDLASTTLLSFEPPVVADPSAMVVFAFGNRCSSDGNLLPGPVNLDLSALADAWARSTGLPVFAQWEVADEMDTPAERVGVVTSADGTVEYLSTAGVADQVRSRVEGRRVAVLAMADHAVRCCRTLEQVGVIAGVPDGVELPSGYDRQSHQPWTRDRATYVAVDILARCLT